MKLRALVVIVALAAACRSGDEASPGKPTPAPAPAATATASPTPSVARPRSSDPIPAHVEQALARALEVAEATGARCRQVLPADGGLCPYFYMDDGPDGAWDLDALRLGPSALDVAPGVIAFVVSCSAPSDGGWQECPFRPSSSARQWRAIRHGAFRAAPGHALLDTLAPPFEVGQAVAIGIDEPDSPTAAPFRIEVVRPGGPGQVRVVAFVAARPDRADVPPPPPPVPDVPAHVAAALTATIAVADQAVARCPVILQPPCFQPVGTATPWDDYPTRPTPLGPTPLDGLAGVDGYTVDCVEMLDRRSARTCGFRPMIAPDVLARVSKGSWHDAPGFERLAFGHLPPVPGEGVLVAAEPGAAPYLVQVVRAIDPARTARVIVYLAAKPAAR